MVENLPDEFNAYDYPSNTVYQTVRAAFLKEGGVPLRT